MVDLENPRGCDSIPHYELFLDLDDVMIVSHNQMNSDLVYTLGRGYDFNTANDYQKTINDCLDAVSGISDDLGKRVREVYENLRITVLSEGMAYNEMRYYFDQMHRIGDDELCQIDALYLFHNIIFTMEHYFIDRESFLDRRDHQLYLDNLLEREEASVHYENYYTREQMEKFDITRNLPSEVDKLNKQSVFNKPIKVLTHMNGKNEIAAKTRFLDENFNNLEFVPLHFHACHKLDPKFRRPRNSKARYIISLGYDISTCILVDDSTDNIDNWVKNGGIGILFDKTRKKKDTDKYAVIYDVTCDAIMNALARVIAMRNNTSTVSKSGQYVKAII